MPSDVCLEGCRGGVGERVSVCAEASTACGGLRCKTAGASVSAHWRRRPRRGGGRARGGDCLFASSGGQSQRARRQQQRKQRRGGGAGAGEDGNGDGSHGVLAVEDGRAGWWATRWVAASTKLPEGRGRPSETGGPVSLPGLLPPPALGHAVPVCAPPAHLTVCTYMDRTLYFILPPCRSLPLWDALLRLYRAAQGCRAPSARNAMAGKTVWGRLPRCCPQRPRRA